MDLFKVSVIANHKIIKQNLQCWTNEYDGRMHKNIEIYSNV
jgi:hypothetical protein